MASPSQSPRSVERRFQRAIRVLRSNSNSTKLHPAIAELRAIADSGHAGAQFELAVAYDLGTGVHRNRVRALGWMLLAAGQGDADAAIQVVLMAGGLRSDQIGRAWDWSRRRGLSEAEVAAAFGCVRHDTA